MSASEDPQAGVVTTIDPATGSRLDTYEETSDQRVDAILDRASRAAAPCSSVGT